MDHQKLILDKLTGILAVTDNKSAQLLDLVEKAGRTFIGGAGRSLLVSRFFAMRLVHAGYNVNMIGEVVTPAIKSGDLLVLVSGSGVTETLLQFVKKAKSVGAKLVFISMKK
jgi:6-phospho-3-hexuloisomerase